jgi:type I restriction enzyme S subunit
MSRVDDLIAEHCPDGVEFKELGAIVKIASSRMSSADLDETTYVGVDNLLPNFGGRRDSGYGANSSGAIKFVVGDILIGNIRPYLKKVWLADRDGGASPDVLIVTLLPGSARFVTSKFLYYVIASDAFIDYSMQHAKGAKMPRGDKSAIMKYRVPVPPRAIQDAIVEILDKFSLLRADLEAELEFRSRQFAHYRDSLLAFEGEKVEWSPLSELGQFIRGKRFTKADYEPDGIGCIHYGEIYTHFGTSATEVVSHLRPEIGDGLRYAEPGDVVIVDVGETVEDVGKAVAWIGNTAVAIHDHSYAFRHELNSSYVSYVMQTGWFMREKLKYIARTKVNTLLIEGFSKIEIPIPGREEQDRIVEILDKFDTLVNDLSVGLPAEIAARRQQYEYYRDMLLTFEEAA